MPVIHHQHIAVIPLLRKRPPYTLLLDNLQILEEHTACFSFTLTPQNTDERKIHTEKQSLYFPNYKTLFTPNTLTICVNYISNKPIMLFNFLAVFSFFFFFLFFCCLAL